MCGAYSHGPPIAFSISEPFFISSALAFWGVLIHRQGDSLDWDAAMSCIGTPRWLVFHPAARASCVDAGAIAQFVGKRQALRRSVSFKFRFLGFTSLPSVCTHMLSHGTFPSAEQRAEPIVGTASVVPWPPFTLSCAEPEAFQRAQRQQVSDLFRFGLGRLVCHSTLRARARKRHRARAKQKRKGGPRRRGREIVVASHAGGRAELCATRLARTETVS